MVSVLSVILIIATLIAFAHVLVDMKKTQTASDFFLHGENLKLFPLISTLVSSNLSLGNMIFVCGIMGYFYGWSGVFWVVITIVMLGVGFLLFAGRFKAYVEERGNFGSVHDFIARSHGGGNEDKRLGLKFVTGTVSALSLLIALILEAHLGTKFLSQVYGIDQLVAITAFMVLVCAYTATAGFYTVVFTDTVQFLLMFAAAVAGVLLFLMLPDGKSFAELGYNHDATTILTGVGWPTATGLVVLGFFWLIGTPDTWQRNSAARSMEIGKTGVFWGTVLMCIWVTLFALAGMMVRSAVEPAVPSSVSGQLSGGYFPFNDIFLLDFSSMGFFAEVAAAFIAAGMIMAAISTVDTFLVVIGHIVNVDIGLTRKSVGSLRALKPSEDRALLLRGRFLILLLGICTIVGWVVMLRANWLVDPLSLFFIIYTLQFALALPAIAGTYPRFVNGTATFYIVLFSAAVTLLVGIWAMNRLDSAETFVGLTPASWLALIPCVPISLGIIGYLAVGLKGTKT